MVICQHFLGFRESSYDCFPWMGLWRVISPEIRACPSLHSPLCLFHTRPGDSGCNCGLVSPGWGCSIWLYTTYIAAPCPARTPGSRHQAPDTQFTCRWRIRRSSTHHLHQSPQALGQNSNSMVQRILHQMKCIPSRKPSTTANVRHKTAYQFY